MVFGMFLWYWQNYKLDVNSHLFYKLCLEHMEEKSIKKKKSEEYK